MEPTLSISELFKAHKGNRTSKWRHYLEIYDEYLGNTRARVSPRPVRLLEIGVRDGGSLEIWRSYLGPDAEIYAIDAAPECARFEAPNLRVFIGDQANRDFLNAVRGELPQMDIIIDDGGHMPHQQIASFEVLFPCLMQGGYYIVEDLHTSYWPAFGGGFGRNSFIEYSKRLIDLLHGWYWYNQSPTSFKPGHGKGPRLDDVPPFTRNARSLHFYDSMLVVERGNIEPPVKDEFGGI